MQNRCIDCSDNTNNECRRHKQSPINLEKDSTAWRDCKDWHRVSWTCSIHINAQSLSRLMFHRMCFCLSRCISIVEIACLGRCDLNFSLMCCELTSRRMGAKLILVSTLALGSRKFQEFDTFAICLLPTSDIYLHAKQRWMVASIHGYKCPKSAHTRGTKICWWSCHVSRSR